MQTTQLDLGSAQNFLDTLESGGAPITTEIIKEDDTNKGDTPGGDPIKSTEDFLKEINSEDELKKEEKEAEEKKEDLSKLTDTLLEKGLLYPFEDGTKPLNEEELLEALTQSNQVNVSKLVQEQIQTEIEKLPVSIQTIIEYGKNGLTSARELQNFTSQVADFEDVSKLNTEEESDQELIVYNQLLSTGLSDEMVRSQIDILKNNGKLQDVSEQYLPILKEKYRQQVEQSVRIKEQKEQEVYGIINNNETYVKHFLDKENDYLPFKIDDQKQKAKVYDLAATVKDFTEDGQPIYGWEAHIRSLQYGGEAEYKKFMKFMNFLADDSYYEKKISKLASTQATLKEIKQIKVVEPPRTGMNQSDSRESSPVIKRNTGPLTFQ